MHACIHLLGSSFNRSPQARWTGDWKEKKKKGRGDFGERVIGLGDLSRGKGGGGWRRGGGEVDEVVCYVVLGTWFAYIHKVGIPEKDSV